MPIYEFECPYGHRIELFRYISQRDYPVVCIPCSRISTLPVKAERIPSRFSTTQVGKPTIVFVNPQTGESQVAVSSHEKPPPGFVKEELKGSIERSKFEKVQSEIAKQQDDIYNESIRQKREEFKSQHIDAIRSHLADDAASSENPAATEMLMNKAIERIRKKPSLKKKRKTEFRFDVNHLDKSNLG